ncbi:SOS response-associated peptidase family protein [Halopseudomonas sp.]|uniref:SOS response-associated peptidase family protein n=1 Tax=Halopseudomonas sp. TaxID=2901191 RepID=UPI003FA59755|tara:strand:+ start:368 stop:832 length:465 start_codon:yes stop_codon:yes gene_type:complete
MHFDDDGLRMSSVPWECALLWARGSGKRHTAINARLETPLARKYWKAVWTSGRCLAPADGWHQCVKNPDDPKRKQPFNIRLKSDKPMFYAALGHFSRGSDEAPSGIDGCAIVTSASDLVGASFVMLLKFTANTPRPLLQAGYLPAAPYDDKERQ